MWEKSKVKMVEVAGFEPASAISSSSSHPQVWFIFLNKQTAWFWEFPLLSQALVTRVFIFRQDHLLIRYWVTRSAKTQQVTLLERWLESDYCYWQLSSFQ
jgi:hypothetical protein